ncbi:MAG: RHS repeat-associated core domain-containing protein [Deltaproteobacteria bacterium]|nr:RHS repeat-associated core domain-containing protein [Deltaproteobacteria bacterium]
MQAPIVTATSLDFPSSPTFTLTSNRTVTLADPHDPLSLTSQTNTATIGGNTTTTTYTAATKTFVATSAAGRVSTMTIDALGRLVSIQLGNLAPKQVTYDARGRLATLTAGTGPTARTLTYTYDADGFVDTITDALGRTSSLSHDLAGRVTTKTLPSGKVVALAYDASGNLVSVTPPGRPAHTLAFSDRNELILTTPPTVPGTGTLAFAYDLDRAMTGVTRTGTDAMTIGYDTAGRPVTRTQNLGGPPLVDTFDYDATGRLAEVAGASGVVIDYTYDGLLSVGETMSGPVPGSVTRTYDALLRVASQTVGGTPTIGYTYDPDSQLTGAGALSLTHDATNGLVTGHTLGVVTDTVGYNTFAELTSYAASANATPVYAETVTRDAIGRIVQKVETIGGVTDTYDYTFDQVGQLITVTKNGAPSESYTYDDNGNRTDATVAGVHVSTTTDAQDRLTQYGTTSFTYTPAGDRESKTTAGSQTTTYEYDVIGSLLTVTLPDTTAITYVVDGQTRRVGKKVNGTLVQGFLYDGLLRPVAELDGNGTIVSRFVYTGGTVPAYLVKGGVAFRVISDTIGSVRLVVNAATGAIAQRLDYDTFGRVTQDTNPGFQPFGFAGGLYDPDTKLVRFGARDYDAVTGCWTAKDPSGFAGNDPNLYRYALNDPLDVNDPSGLDWYETFTGFEERYNADIQLATNPMLALEVGIDAVVNLTAVKLGFDPGPTLYDQLFRPPSRQINRSSSDYLDGEFYAQCVDLALAVVDAAGMGISEAGTALESRAVRLANDEVARQVAERAARQAANGAERASDRLQRNLNDIGIEQAHFENAAGNTTRGSNAAGGFTNRGDLNP